MCGQVGHFQKECPMGGQGDGGNETQSSSIAPLGRVVQKSATSRTEGGSNRLYAVANCQGRPDVVTGMLKVLSTDVYLLLDPRANLSFVNPYVPVKFRMQPESLFESFSVFTPVGESTLAKEL